MRAIAVVPTNPDGEGGVGFPGPAGLPLIFEMKALFREYFS